MSFSPGTPNRAAWLLGGESYCDLPPHAPIRTRRLVVLGAPGVGKSTQAELLAHRLSTCHLAVGDVFRAAKASSACDCSPVMIHALEYVRIGRLVPDEIVQNLLIERSRCLRCKGGFVLDGFPATRAQAEGLEDLLAGQDVKLDAVIRYELSDKTALTRLGERRTCPGCRTIFNMDTWPPKVSGICDNCGSDLYQREDDQPGVVCVRMDEYQANAESVADFFRRKNIFVSVNAEGSPEEIFDRTLVGLQKRQS